KGHLGAVVKLGFNHDDDLLMSESWDSTCRLWDPRTGQQLLCMPGGLSAEFGPDGKGLDYAWQGAGRRACRTYHGLKNLSCVAINPKGRLMASVNADGVELWDLAAKREGDKH